MSLGSSPNMRVVSEEADTTVAKYLSAHMIEIDRTNETDKQGPFQREKSTKPTSPSCSGEPHLFTRKET